MFDGQLCYTISEDRQLKVETWKWQSWCVVRAHHIVPRRPLRPRRLIFCPRLGTPQRTPRSAEGCCPRHHS